MLATICVILAAFIALVIAAASAKPDTMSLSRTIIINAPASTIFPHVNNLHQWKAWSPWAKLDPNTKEFFEGPDAGIGAAMSWNGNMQVGKGKMTITESRPDAFLRLQLDFEKPMKGTSSADFTFTPESGNTIVTWSMEGKNCFMAKVMSLVLNCEKMVGTQYDKGLASLKALTEGK